MTKEKQNAVKSSELNGYPKKAIEHMSQPGQPHPQTLTALPQPEIPIRINTIYTRYIRSYKRILTQLGIKTHLNTLKFVSPPKDPIPTQKKSGVVYCICISCGSCPHTYIEQKGKTDLRTQTQRTSKAV